MKLYQVEYSDSLSDYGESYTDSRVYNTPEAAARRAKRIELDGMDDIETWTTVHALEACWDVGHEIVRCRECEHYTTSGMYKGCCLLHAGWTEDAAGVYEMPLDGFCSEAKRRN